MTRMDLKKYRLPDRPGVYLFLGSPKHGGGGKKGTQILYIGKAASLRDRVRSYFSRGLAEVRSPAVAAMVEKATSVAWRKTDSVLEALILEANLIKRHEPPYNVDQKDNKSWNYLVVTKEDFPRVLAIRGRELFNLKTDSRKLKAVFGPYPHGGQLKDALKMVRRVFPFRDKCRPGGEKPCFNRQLGLCPGVCTGEVTRKGYAKTVRNIRDLFSGKFKGLRQRLAREMKAAAKREDFERAEVLRRQVSALEHVRDVSLIKNEQRMAPGGLIRTNKSHRIEAFDVAHTGGAETVAVMAVLEDGIPSKKWYRKFRIRSSTNDDVAALKEALSRRLGHLEWPLPRLFVMDGGKTQVRAAENILHNAGVRILVVGVVKDSAHRPKGIIGNQHVIEKNENDILLANSEAHRFAINWHRRRRGRLMI